MSKEKFKYGNLDIVVEDVGEGIAPWDEKGDTRHEYKITVKGPGGARYSSGGWGSINDFQKGEMDHRSMAWSTIMDLLSANSDPDEFINMVIGEAPGRKALERGKLAEKIVKAASKFSNDDLNAASEKAQEEGA